MRKQLAMLSTVLCVGLVACSGEKEDIHTIITHRTENAETENAETENAETEDVGTEDVGTKNTSDAAEHNSTSGGTVNTEKDPEPPFERDTEKDPDNIPGINPGYGNPEKDNTYTSYNCFEDGVFKMRVGNRIYEYNTDTDMTDMHEIPKAWSVANSYRDRTEWIEVGDPCFVAADGLEMTSTVVDRHDVNCLVGERAEIRSFSDHIYMDRLSRVWGCCQLFAVGSGQPKEYEIGGKTVSVRTIGRNEKAFPYVSVSLVNDYEIDGVSPDSSVEEIIANGFRESLVAGVYYKIYSRYEPDWERIRDEYIHIQKADLPHADIVQGALTDYIFYGNVAAVMLPTLYTVDDKALFNVSLPSIQRRYEFLTQVAIPAMNEDFDAYMMYALAISEQVNNLELRVNDDFIVATIDVNKVGYNDPSVGRGNLASYEGNTAQVTFVTRDDNMRKVINALF